MRWHALRRRLAAALLLACLLLPAVDSSARTPDWSFDLDGVTLLVHTDLLSPLHVVVAAPGNADQVATATQRRPFRELSVTAARFGLRPGTEQLPAAQAGAAPAYRAALAAYRAQQHGRSEPAPGARIFGQEIAGEMSVVPLRLYDRQLRTTAIGEWVAEAGGRLWIVRLTEELPLDTTDVAAGAGSPFRDLVITSSTLDRPSTVGIDQPAAPRRPQLRPPTGARTAADLPVPAWWSGDCDYNGYLSGSGGWAPYRLGGVYAGVPACGPRPAPNAENAPDVLVSLPGGWGEYEWECVELAMRYLALQYGVDAYGANGSQVVWNYSGSLLQQIGNGSSASPPQPGDVLSYGATDSFGHTSIVSAANIDTNGNGSIDVVEQNNSASGSSSLAVSGWWVEGNAGTVSGWLHGPAPVQLQPVVFVPLLLAGMP